VFARPVAGHSPGRAASRPGAGAQQAAGNHGDPVPERGLGERAAIGPARQAHPEGEAAVRFGPRPLGQVRAQRSGQRVVPGPQPLPAPLDDVVVPVIQQRGQDGLREGGAAQVGRGLGRGHPGDQARGGPDPAGPQAAPVKLGQRADADQVRLPGGEGGQRGRRRVVAERQFDQGHVVDEQGVRVRRGELGHAAAVPGRHDQARRVVVRGDQVDQRRMVRSHRVLEPVRVQAGAGRDPDHPGTGPVQRVERAGEGRILDDHRLAGQHLTPDEQVYGLLAAGRDDHLGRVGGQPETFGQVAGDRGAQGRPPEREVPAGGGHRIGPGRVGQRRRHLRRAVHRGQGEVRVEHRVLQQAREEAVGPVHRGRGGAVRDDTGAGALTALRHALVPQHLVGSGHGVPAHRQGGGQVAFGGQPQARG
jgi:hypothetical protein